MVWLVIAYRTPCRAANCIVFFMKMATEKSKRPKKIAKKGTKTTAASIIVVPRWLPRCIGSLPNCLDLCTSIPALESHCDQAMPSRQAVSWISGGLMTLRRGQGKRWAARVFGYPRIQWRNLHYSAGVETGAGNDTGLAVELLTQPQNLRRDRHERLRPYRRRAREYILTLRLVRIGDAARFGAACRVRSAPDGRPIRIVAHTLHQHVVRRGAGGSTQTNSENCGLQRGTAVRRWESDTNAGIVGGIVSRVFRS